MFPPVLAGVKVRPDPERTNGGAGYHLTACVSLNARFDDLYF